MKQPSSNSPSTGTATADALDARAPRNGLSHVVGDTSAPLARLTIPAFLAQAVARGGTREAVVFCEQEIRWSWHTFAQRIDELRIVHASRSSLLLGERGRATLRMAGITISPS